MTTYLPTSTWTFFTLNVDKKKHFLTTYPPHLVHVVFERPLIPAFLISIDNFYLVGKQNKEKMVKKNHRFVELGIVKTCDEPDLWKRLNAPQELDQIIVGPNVNQLIETRQILNGEVPRLQKLMQL